MNKKYASSIGIGVPEELSITNWFSPNGRSTFIAVTTPASTGVVYGGNKKYSGSPILIMLPIEINGDVEKSMRVDVDIIVTLKLLPIPLRLLSGYSYAPAGTVPEFLTNANHDASFFSNQAASINPVYCRSVVSKADQVASPSNVIVLNNLFSNGTSFKTDFNLDVY
jgi:hypothetical protein